MMNRRFQQILVLTLLLVTPVALAGSADVPRSLPTDDKIWRVANQCSVNALYMLLRLHGKETKYAAVEERLPVRETGTNLAELRNCAAEFGLTTQVIKATPDSLSRCPLPAIGHWEEQLGLTGHFVIIVSVKDDWVEYVDGTTAVRDVLPMPEFKRRWSGHLLVVQERPWWRWLFLIAAVFGTVPPGLALWWRWRSKRSEKSSPSPAQPEPASTNSAP